ncbi:hypothetical protein DPMN_057685 [Dreissena polymorpha]|uniref:Fibronectin type-III domain-containing protein n=2 Tax=Dreissena polymorpha TaxID=45954 RepID=A0A9D4C0P4_DREPO|nr:hypothetical protein DPMN_057685 [Dreissena polymorpha]
MARKRDVPITDTQISKTHYPESYTKEPVKRRFRESKDIEKDHYVEPQKDEHEKLLDTLRRNRIESETTQDSSRVIKVFDYGHSQNFVVDRIEKDSEEKKVERYSREKQTHTYRDDGNRYERYEIIEEDKFVDRISENISRAPSKMLRRDHSFERDIDKPSGYSTERYDDDYRRQYNEEKHSFNEDYHGRQGSLPYTKIDIPYDDDYDYRKRSATDKNNEGAKGKMHSDTGKGELEADESPINWNDSHLFDKQFDEVVEGEHDTPLYSAENLERRSSNAYSHVQGKSEEFDVRPRNNDVGFWERSDYGVNKNVTSKNSDESVHCFERVTKGTDNNGVNENDWVKEYYDFDPNYKRNKKRGEDKDVSKIDQTYDNIDLDRHYNRNAKVTDYDYEIVTRVSEDRTRVSEDRTRVNEDRTKVNEDHPQRQNKYRYEDNRNRYDKYNRDNVDREFETQSRDGRSQQQFRHRQPSEEEDHMGEKRVSEAYYHQRKIPSKAQSIHDSDRREMYDVVVGKQEEFPYFDVQEIDTSIDKFEERKPIDRFTERNRRPFESGATGNLEPDSEKITGVTSDFFCKDCNLVCVDESVFEAHLKGDLHLLTLQKKAQELFNIQAKTSRFDTDKYGNPLKALVAPTTLMTGINTSGVMVTSSQDVASDRTASEHSNTGPSRPQGPHSSNRVQVIPPKPLGPLEARSIHYTWLMLYWHTRTPAEEQLVGKYVVEYRNARETSWARAGQTKRHEFEVTGLQAGTDYLFRVYSVNGEEKSEMLESVLITTQKRRDIDRRLSDREHERGRRSRSRERIRNREQVRPRIRSGEYRRSRTPERRRRSRSPNYKRRSRSRERKKSRDSSSSKSKDTEGDHKKDSDSKGENKGGQDLTKADNGSSLEPEHLKIDKVENEAPEKNESADAETTRKNEEPVVDRNVECLLYKEFHTALESPLLGLEDIYEFHDFNEKIPQHYICKLCNNKGSHKVILRHIMGTPHKLAFFKKHYPDLHESISMIAIKKQQQARLNYEGRKIEREKGRGAVKVLHMLNPVDNKGKKKYTKPVAVPAPPLEGSEELGIPPVAEQIMYLSQFDQICQAYEQTGAEDICIVGLDFIKELMHPLMAEECKYSCSLCKSLCGASTIMYHLVGRRHRIAYLKANHPQVWNDLKHRRDLKSVLVDKIRVLSKKVGRGTLVSKVAQNDRAWRRTNKKIKEVGEEGETYYEEGNQLHLDEGEPDEIEAQDGIEDEAPQEVPLQNEKKVPRGMPAIKFDIKKIEPTSTVVQPINILEQSPAKKGVFDWNKENSILQDRIQNQSIIKSTRKSKFITVYSGFFQRCPVIGMQWVTEFQKPDVKLEPWFLCFICQQRLQWKNILDHVTSTVHRLNYMKKSNFREKYSTIYTVIKTDKAHAKSLIEQYSREISELEGPPTSVEVMLELNINMEAFKGVSKIQENIKAHSVSSSHVESSLQVTAADTTLPSTVSASSDSVTSTSCASTDTAMALPQLSTSLSFPTLNPMSTTAGHSAPFIATPILDPHIPPVLPDMSVPPPGFPHFPLPTFPPPPLGSNMQTAPHLLHVPPIGFTGSGGNILNIPPPVSHHSMLPGLGLTSDASLSYSVTNTSLPGQVPTCMAPSSVFQPPAFVQSLTGFEPSSYPPYSSVNSRSEMSQPVTVTSQSYSLAAPLISAAPPFTASTDHVTNWHDPHKLPSNEYQGALPLTSETPWQHTEDSRRQVDLSSAINCVSSTRDSESRPGQINFSSQNVSSEFEDLQSRLLSDNRYHERERFENDEVGYVKDEYSYEGTYEKYRDSHGYDPERPGFDRGEKRKYESSGNSRDSRRRHYDRGSRTRHDLRSESPSRKDREVYSRRHSRSRSPENRVRNDRERDRQRSHSP